MATRARNEGSMYRQQTAGRWVAAISVGYRNGRRRRKKCVGATRGAVAAQLPHALHDHQHGLPVAPDRQTVGTWLTRWLEDSVKPSVRPTTYRSSQQVVDRHLTPGLGRDPLAKLTPPLAHVPDVRAQGSAVPILATALSAVRRDPGQGWRSEHRTQLPQGLSPRVEEHQPRPGRTCTMRLSKARSCCRRRRHASRRHNSGSSSRPASRSRYEVGA